MIDALSVADRSSCITASGLNGVKLPFEDLQMLKTAPAMIQTIQYEVWAVERALESLKCLDQHKPDRLGSNVAQQVHETVITCSETCIWFRGKLQRWCKHSTEQELARKDKVEIAFQQTQMDIVSEKLRSCNLVIISVTGSATLHTSLQNLKLSADRDKEIELIKLALQRATVVAHEESWRLLNMSEELMKTNGIDTRIDGDTYAKLVRRLEVYRKAAEAAKEILMELVSRLPAAASVTAGAISYGHSGQTALSAYSFGLQAQVVNSRHKLGSLRVRQKLRCQRKLSVK